MFPILYRLIQWRSHSVLIMSCLTVAAFCALLATTWCSRLQFPPGFHFGAATSSYQIEGGWDADGKGPSIWDRLFHSAANSGYYNQTGDVAADSYHQWRQDVKAAADMGLDFYRFSISWPRILPTGRTNLVNPAGVRYYSELIDALLAAGVKPVVTLYHFELPASIQDIGGWTNPLIVHLFGEYARLVYSLYADRVDTWITINEGIVICDLNYNLGQFAPQIKEPTFAPFLCNKHVMLAHAKAYRIYDEEFRAKYGGKVSIANNLLWVEPVTPNDLELAELGRQHSIGRFSHPIFSKEGGWPPTTEKLMRSVSRREGYTQSRLPAFTDEEKKFVRGTADFFSLNHYTTSMIRPARAGESPGTWFINGSVELGAVLEHPPGSTYGALDFMPIYPPGIRRLLNWVRQQYGAVEVFVSENGLATSGKNLDDHIRVDYLTRYMEQVLLAIEDGVRVTGYTVWSLIDNFEWFDGYNTKFGLYEVDFEDPARCRRPRLSAHHYACVITHRTLNYPLSCVQERQSGRR